MKENEMKKRLEATLEGILYFVSEDEQDSMLAIVKKYNDRLPDSKIKDKWESIIFNIKKDYYSKMEALIKDIIDSKYDTNNKKIISEMLDELQPGIEHGQKSFWNKLKDLFKWS